LTFGVIPLVKSGSARELRFNTGTSPAAIPVKLPSVTLRGTSSHCEGTCNYLA
jgi:hypothetical protein